MKIFLVVLGFVALLGIGLAANILSINAYGIETEESIEATFKNNRNILSQYGNRIADMVQVPAMARDDLKSVVESAMQGRYGADGSQAAVQVIVEKYPGQIDPSLYLSIQNEISSGRRKFEENQTLLIDKKRGYQTALRYPWRGFILRSFGFPHLKLDDMKVVESSDAIKSFETGVDDGLKLR